MGIRRRGLLAGLSLLAIAVAVAGCDGSDPSPDATGEFSGIFSYTVDGEAFQEEWVFDLTEGIDGRIDGSGLHGDDFVTIVGSHQHPDIELEFDSERDGYLGKLSGTLSDDGDRIEGTFTLSVVFVAIPVTLERTG